MGDKLPAAPRRKFQFLPLSLHIETLGGIATPFVLRGTPLPAVRTQSFGTAADNQESVEVKVLMGESPLSEKNRVVGRFQLTGIPKAPRGQPQIIVKFAVDEYCTVNATASLGNSEIKVDTTIEDPQQYLNPKAIQEALSRAEVDKSEDQARVSVIEARLSANAAIAKAERDLASSTMTSERRREIDILIADVGLALESGILERIHVATQTLERTVNAGSFRDIFGDLFGVKPATANPPTGRKEVRFPAAEMGTTGRRATATKSAKQTEPQRSPKIVTLGRIFGGGDFALDSSLCFVLMPFADKFQAVYDDHIKPVVTQAGLSSQRADEIASTNLITWDIWERLNKARLVIADLTDRNPNVFYEVGLAHAISKEVILLTQNMGDIPFDLQSLRFIVYEYSPRGMQEFEKKLRSAIATLLQAS